MIGKILFFLLLLLITIPVSAQVRVRGKVVDERTKSGLPFASISLRHTFIGTTADSSGHFVLSVPNLASELIIHVLGYEPRTVRADNASLVILAEGHQHLAEVTVRFVNPAHRIIEQAVEKLPQNDPEKLLSFQYEGYHVSTVGSSGQPSDVRRKKASRLIKRLDSTHLYVNESYSTQQFMAPNLSREVITASHTTGSKSTLLPPCVRSYNRLGFTGLISSFGYR